MDPASAIIGVVSFGFTIIGQLNKIRKAFKDAPEQVQAVQDSSVAVSLLLSRIQVAGGCSLSRSPQTNAYFEPLCKRAEDCLKKVGEALQKVIAQIPPDGDGNDNHKPRLNWRRWFMDKGALADLTGKLADVRKALCEMLEFLQVNYLEYIADRVDNVELVVNTMSMVQSYHTSRLEDIADRVGRFEHAVGVIVASTIQATYSHSPTNTAGMIDDTRHDSCPSADLPECEDNVPIDLSGMPPDVSHPHTNPRVKTICDSDIAPISDDQGDDCGAKSTPSVALGSSRFKGPLRCPPQCKCRCHYPSVTRLVPERLASYVGQLTISKRLLHPTFSPWSLCNVQTCRGDFQRAATVQWVLPFRILQGFLESRNDCRIHFSIGAPRIVPWDSPIVYTVYDGDLQGVRNLFATGKASIWDYTMNGTPIFRYACHRWQRDPTEGRLEIIHLFIEAGAEMLLFEETETAYSAYDALTGGFFTYLLGDTSDASQSLATVVRTNTAAIQIFRSLLNIDPMDALEDYLDRTQAQCTDVTGFMASLEDTRCNPESRSSVFQVIDYSPLRYAIYFSPKRVESLLADGEDVTAEPYLVYVVSSGLHQLIKPLLDAGADVNMRNWWGHTTLLEACSRCFYDAFLELLRWAEDEIDWDARAPDGRNALELFDWAVSAQVGYVTSRSQSQIDEFRAELVAHMKFVDDEFGGQLYMPGAFPDAL